MHKARAKTPSWLLVLSGHGSGASGDDDGLPWCSLCLRKGAEAADGAVNTIGEDDKGNDGGDERGDDLGDPGTSRCASGIHLFCWSCVAACGGKLLCARDRCPLCRLGAKAGGFDALVQQSRPLRLPHPREDWSGTRRLLLRGTLSAEDRCELTTAIAADRCRELRQSMRQQPKKELAPKRPARPSAEEPAAAMAGPPPGPAYDPSDIGEVMRAFARALPTHDDLPPGLCEDIAVVSNSSALLGRKLGGEIDAHSCVVRFNEFTRAGPGGGAFAPHVGTRTTCHVISEQVVAEGGLSDEAMVGALRSTPMTVWMPPMAWGNSTYYSRYVRVLLGCAATDGLDLTPRERRRVVLLRPSVSFAMWKYFRPLTWGRKENAAATYTPENQNDGEGDGLGNSDSDEQKMANGEDWDESRSRPGAGTTGFKFALLAMGLSDQVCLYGFEDDPRNAMDAAGGHYFNAKHVQEAAYDIGWEREQLRRYADMGHVRRK